MSDSKNVVERAERAGSCGLYKNENVADEHFCKNSNQAMCAQCDVAHRNARAATKQHNVVMRSKLTSVNTASVVCTDHEDKVISLKCVKCKVLICMKCTSGKHRGHETYDLSKAYQEERVKLERVISNLEEQVLPAITDEAADNHSRKTEYKRKITGMREDMEEEVYTLKYEIDRLHNERMETLSLIEDNDVKKHDEYERELDARQTELKGRIAEYKDVIAKSSQTMFLRFVENQGTSLQEATKVPSLNITPPTFYPAPQKHSKLGEFFRSIETRQRLPLKKVVCPVEISKFSSSLKGEASICATGDGNAWIGGCDSRKVVLVDKQGKVLKIKKRKARTNDIAMLAPGELVISQHPEDSKSVVILKKDHTEQTVFNGGKYGCMCLSITRDNHILICTVDGRVMRCNSSGQSIEQLYQGKTAAVHAVEDNMGHIYISFHNDRIVLIDSKGDRVSTITNPLGRTGVYPFGLAKDRFGNILITDRKNDCIYIIDENRHLRELIGSSYCIRKLNSMDVDTDDDLWITTDDGTIYVLRYLSSP